MKKTRLIVVKMRKNLLIGDHCSQCGSSQELSLVHLWHPPKRAVIREEISEDFCSDLIDQGVINKKSSWKKMKRKYADEIEELVDLVESLYRNDYKLGLGTKTLCERCISNWKHDSFHVRPSSVV